ncbi:MAG: hypothetical protein LBQ35_09205 [Spirochaetaceae bacterium]|jgi:hypothetical protein|nr:hypothetical protein [Spirochaetaceae bacterium]
MRQNSGNRLRISFIFLGGVLLIFLGCTFLFFTFTQAPRGPLGLAVFSILTGSLFTFIAVKRKKKGVYLFFAAFSILVGFFLFLSSLGVIPIAPRRWWPAISIFAGLSMLPAGWHHFGSVKSTYVVPAALFVILGALLLFFSLGIVAFSFRQFMIRWWPLLLAMAGLILMLISLGTKFLPDPSSEPQRSEGSPGEEDSGRGA